MKKNIPGAELGYKKQQHHVKDILKSRDISEWHNKGTISYQLRVLTMDILSPFYSHRNSWLTIGDFAGVEANYLQDQNQEVTASDISELALKEAYDRGLIKSYSLQNVENITYDTGSFDYVICREAFHHFPRAYLGLYEMIRVAKKAAIVIEPIDILSKIPWILLLKNICDKISPSLINRFWKNRFSFETAGNYVFKLSAREVEKMAMGIGLPCLALREMNILRLEGDYPELNKIPPKAAIQRKFLGRIRRMNFISRLGLIPYNTLCCIIFNEMPTQDIKSGLVKMGFSVLDLPTNPYLNGFSGEVD